MIGKQPEEEYIRDSKKLWGAVLEQAIEDYKNTTKPKFHNSAKYWFFKSQEDGVGSLPWICGYLNIDINCLREKIK